jgi:hypothetical protein
MPAIGGSRLRCRCGVHPAAPGSVAHDPPQAHWSHGGRSPTARLPLLSSMGASGQALEPGAVDARQFAGFFQRHGAAVDPA